MKFVRRPDLDPQSRIHIVMLAWLNQGVYGKMTHIAQYYRISRTFLYQLLFVATLQLETLLSDEERLFRTTHLVITFGRQMLDSESICDFKAPGIPAQLRGLSQRILPTVWSGAAFDPVHGIDDRRVLSQR